MRFKHKRYKFIPILLISGVLMLALILGLRPTAAQAQSIEVSKSISPTTLTPLPEPGGLVTYTINITKTGAATATLSITDVFTSLSTPLINGPLTPASDCLSPPSPMTAATYSCIFVFDIMPDATGLFTPTMLTNEVSVTAAISGGAILTDTADFTITTQNAAPNIDILKTASPATIPELGGVVTFTVVITNGSIASDTVTITNITDTTSSGSIPISFSPGLTIPAGASQTVIFTQTVSGNSGDVITDTVVVEAEDEEGQPITDTSDAEVTITSVPPTFKIQKLATPTMISESVGSVTFTVIVTNTSLPTITDPITITSLTDSVHGNLLTQGTCTTATTTVITNVSSYSCSFTVPITGDAGYTETDIITIDVVDDDGDTASGTSNSVTVTMTNRPPDLDVLKIANPTTLQEPGGIVNFTVVITNSSIATTDPITLTNLTDTVSTGAVISLNGPCGLPVVITQGTSLTCTFTQSVTGSAGDIITDTVLAEGIDDEGAPITDTSDAQVTITSLLPTIEIVKSATPLTVTEPGGTVAFTVIITNTSPATTTDPITITSLIDSVHGDLFSSGLCTSAPTPTSTIAFGSVYSCTFTQVVTGNADYTETDVITATVVDDDGDSASGTSNPVTVTVISQPPTIDIVKSATPLTVAEPGGSVTFNVIITNTSPATTTDPITITNLVDSVHGNLLLAGLCGTTPITIPNNGTHSCSFTVPVTGNAGYTETDIITANVIDDDGDTGSGTSNSVTVTVTDVLPTIEVIKAATPITVSEPGGNVSFTITISNTSLASTDPVTVTALMDNVYGNLLSAGFCGTATITIAQGGAHVCTFTQFIAGDAGFTHTNVVTATVQDDENNSVQDRDQATVNVDDVLPAITLMKTANPTLITAPSGTVTFTLVITNISVSTDPVTITNLVDNIHGAICPTAIGQVITATGGTYTCSFTATVTGPGGSFETDIITATVEDNENNSTSASDDATVLIDEEITPTIELIKLANPVTVVEPGGPVTFIITVTNTSPITGTDPVTITSLVDVISGAPPISVDTILGTTCTLPFTLAPGASHSCSFPATISGNAGSVITDTVIAQGTDDEGVPVQDDDGASVTILDAQPTLQIAKSASPTNVTEPGGVVTFTLNIRNISVTNTDPITLTNLTDTVSNGTVLNLNGPCGLPLVLAQGTGIACTFTQTVMGNAGDVITDTVLVEGTDDEGNSVNDSDSAQVTIDDDLPSLEILKTANPITVTEPGAVVNFTVIITNTSIAPTDPITLTNLTDTVSSGAVINLNGPCGLPTVINQGASFTCTFTQTVTGNVGDVITDTVTAEGTDDEGNPANGNDDATVTIDNAIPSITVDKTASPTAVPSSGGLVNFTVAITNTSVSVSDPVTITSIMDNIHGNVTTLPGTCTVPQVIPVGGIYICFFSAMVTGPAGSTEVDTVTASGTDDEGTPAQDNDTASVDIGVSNAIDVIKNANPQIISEPGDFVTFTVAIENESITNTVTITSLVDNIHGNLNGQGTCSVPQNILPGGAYICAFTQFITGNAGYIEIDTITADGTDSAGNDVEDSDQAIVEVQDVTPVFELLKTASPTVVPEPGGLVTFTVNLQNLSHSMDPVTILTMTDSIYGDITMIPGSTCVLPVLAPPPNSGSSYTCQFQAFISGNAGYTETNIIVAEGVDDEGNPATDDDDATVTVDDVDPTVNVTKSASPSTLLEPGGDVAFTLVVDNTSVSTDPITLTNLVDSVHGNLNADCGLPPFVNIPPGGSYSCTFTRTINGDAGFTETDIITATVNDDEGTTTDGSDNATVSIVDVQPSLQVIKTATPTSVVEAGGIVTFTVDVINTSPASIDPITVLTLTDNIYGNLNGLGTCSVTQTIAPGATYRCAFTQLITGNLGDIHVNVITAEGEDNEGNAVNDNDNATVVVENSESSIALIKTVDADGDGAFNDSETLPEPGGTVDYQFVVQNISSADDVTINMVNDPMLGGNISASCAVTLPTTLAPGDSFTCLVNSAVITGDAGTMVNNTASATGVDDDGEAVADTDGADVTLTDVQPVLDVVKTATPISVTESGGNVLFSVVVENDSVSSDPVLMSSLIDNIHGDLNGQGSCVTPQTILAGSTYTCAFTAFISGDAGDSEVDTITATGTDNEGNSTSGQDDAEVSFVNDDPVIDVIKTANPVNVPEPGGNVTFNVVVQNQSNNFDPVTITNLVDNVHGNLNGQGDCAIPVIIQPGDSYTCSFTAFVSGNAGYIETDTITATGQDDDGVVVSDSDDAVVTVSDVAPAILLVKTADPLLAAPAGSNVTFTVAITNVSVSTDPVDIITLTDSIYGNLDGQGTCSMPQTLGSGSTYTCQFVQTVSGTPGDTETNVIIGLGNDDEGNPVGDADDALVTVDPLDPFLAITKGVDANGDGVYSNSESVPEPGGTVNYQVLVENISPLPITITDIDDPNLGGDISAFCTPGLPANLGPGAMITCLFSDNVSGDAGDFVLNIASATGTNGAGNEMADFDDASVILSDSAPLMSITKTATPDNVPETGGDVDFVFVISNNSTAPDPLDIFALQDSVYGDLNGRGTCSVPQTIPVGGSYSCTFTAFVERNADDHETNIAIVAGTDNENNQAIAFTEETVFIDDVLPTINVVKDVAPANINEPGDSVIFTVKIENTSERFDPVTLTNLVDDVHGNLNGQGDCIIPQIIQGGDDYTCSFAVVINGDADFTETDTITATAQDDEGNVVQDADSATVTVDDVLPMVTVVKSANPNAVQEPGGNVAFTVIVTNDSVATDPVTLTDLVDDIHGDLDGQGDCEVPQTLLPARSYTCTFTAFVEGDSGDTEVDTITATVRDNEGNNVDASDSASVAINDTLPILRVRKTPDVNSVPETGGDVTFTIEVSNESVSTDPLTLTSLVDSVHGDLNGKGTCSVPRTIVAGENYVCTFTINLTGNAGDEETNVVTATGEDDEGNVSTDTDDATVTIGNIGAIMNVTKVVDANGDGDYHASETIVAPGGTVAYQIVVQNNSVVDAITVQTVTDAQLGGDISSNCVPTLPVDLAPGQRTVCNVTDDVTGDAGDTIVNVATATAEDDEGNTLSDTADATVAFVAPTADLVVTKEIVETDLIPDIDPNELKVTYRIRYANNGPDPAPGVRIIDDLPDGMEVESSTVPFDSIDLPLLTWDLGTLQSGDSGEIVLVATLNQGTQGEVLTNVVNISCGCPDPSASNDAGSISLTLGQNIVPFDQDPTAVSLISLQAHMVSAGVQIDWETVNEANTVGFDIYRGTSMDTSTAVKVNEVLIPSQGSMGGSYTYVDDTATPGVNYVYTLLEIESGGIQNVYPSVQQVMPLSTYNGYIYLPVIMK